MFFLPVLAALGASAGWATGIVLAQRPAQLLGSFEFTRIQLVACSAILAAMCSSLGYWPSVQWTYWPSFALSISFGIVLGNLAMIERLRRGGPRRTELLLSAKAPLVGIMAYLWLHEKPSTVDVIGAGVLLAGIAIAILYGSNRHSESDKAAGGLPAIIFFGVAAAGLQGFGFLVMKPSMVAGTEPLAASAVRLLGAAFLISVLALWPSSRMRGHTELTPSLLGQTILPGFIGYGVSSSLLLYAFANFDAGIATVLGSLSPVLVLPLLWLKEGIPPRPQAVLGAALAVFGIMLIVLV